MNFYPEQLDLDRLHRVVESINAGQETDRGAGKTTAYVALMIAEIELGDWNNAYLYIGETRQIANAAAQDFAEMVTRKYGKVVLERNTPSIGQISLINGQRYLFRGAHNLDCTMRGLSLDRIFFDVCADSVMKMEDNGSFGTMASTLYPSLASRGGDIV
jgi:hypothetical protein